MINGPHKTTKKQRRATFAASCQQFLNNSMGEGRRKRYFRQMAKMMKMSSKAPAEQAPSAITASSMTV